jgi:hypothetical protein
MAPWETATPPPAEKLAGLRIWRCSGAPCHDATRFHGGGFAAASSSRVGGARAQALAAREAQQAAAHQASSERMERSCTVDVDGMHFCSALCAEAKFKRAIRRYCSVCGARDHANDATYWHDPGLDKHGRQLQHVEKYVHPIPNGVVNVRRGGGVANQPAGPGRPLPDGCCYVTDAWAGELRGSEYDSQAEALKALKDAIRADASYAQGGSMWEGDPLYPSLHGDASAPAARAAGAAAAGGSEARLRTDKALPHLSIFPPAAPAGAFLAHLDAAGAPRSYGKHWPFATGTKIDAVLAEVRRIREASGEMEKAVVFSDSKEVLEVLHEAARRERGDGAVAMILSTTSFDERMQALSKFKTGAGCYLLLLAVGACASGLTLTHANHCILLDLQAYEGKELQLINRVWRIGQEKPVTIKRLVAAGTIEERMLHLRKRSRGLMACEDADTMTSANLNDEPAATGPGASKGKASASAAASAAHAQTEREEDLRYLYGVGTETVGRET